MDSPIVTHIFRQLFGHEHPACLFGRKLARRAAATVRLQPPRHQRRPYSSRRGFQIPNKNESYWRQRSAVPLRDLEEQFKMYPMVTAMELRRHAKRPRRVKMLLRDFIEDSLYNPNYGYFSKQVVIFTPGDEPFDFWAMRDETDFHNELGRRFTAFEDILDAQEASDTRQFWYTPTELFRPYYGEAVASYLVANYKLTTPPYHDLIIYEMGAGRGSLMISILDHIRDDYPDVYERTRYRIVEISAQMAAAQRAQLAAAGHADRVDIINRSIFDWDQPVPSPCFFLAFEVFDNFAHDVVRYDLVTEAPLQGLVLIDEDGEFYEYFTRHPDPVARRFLRQRHAATGGRYPLPYPSSRLARWLASARPLSFMATGNAHLSGLSGPEYLPTRLMEFFDVLARYFPKHRLLTSDFHALSGAVPGLNGPVVQTRYQRTPVSVTTPLVHQGFFDVMFPTDFRVSEAIYQSLTDKFTRVLTHEEFMRSWAYVEDTETRSGENPLLSWYKNASVMLTEPFQIR